MSEPMKITDEMREKREKNIGNGRQSKQRYSICSK